MKLMEIKSHWLRRAILVFAFPLVVYYVIVRDAVTTLFDCWSAFSDAWRGK